MRQSHIFIVPSVLLVSLALLGAGCSDDSVEGSTGTGGASIAVGGGANPGDPGSAVGGSSSSGVDGSVGQGSGGGSSASGGSTTVPSDPFSFFVASLEGMQRLSGNQDGFGGELRCGEADGLADADYSGAGIVLGQSGGSDLSNPIVGLGGGYGGIYCFALTS